MLKVHTIAPLSALTAAFISTEAMAVIKNDLNYDLIHEKALESSLSQIKYELLQTKDPNKREFLTERMAEVSNEIRLLKKYASLSDIQLNIAETQLSEEDIITASAASAQDEEIIN